MPSVSYNGQCFSLDGRRIWILAAALHYARITPSEWADRIADVKQCGFNTVEVACPWMHHEPRKGRIRFQDDANVRHFIELCAEAELKVMLRPGPYIGSGYDGGGLPSWLLEEPGLKQRESNELFIERATRYLRKVLAEVSDLQATHGGPMLTVQIEHHWRCGNDAQAEKYLGDLGRIVHECGITVPLLNANNLWAGSAITIDTWRGSEDLLANLRQLHMVQPNAPRLARTVETQALCCWGEQVDAEETPDLALQRVAETLAAGAQPIVAPFHGGTYFGFTGGQSSGAIGRWATTSAAANAPLGEAGARGERYNLLRRVVSFADSFGHVFADLAPDYQPVTIDPWELRETGRGKVGLSLAPLRGGAGRVIFVFSNGQTKSTTLLLDNGVRMPFNLGRQSVGWCVIDVDLQGSGRLDYSNLSPVALVNRSILVVCGPAKSEAFVSIDGTPINAIVPSSGTPVLLTHKDITLVICNEKQIDTVYWNNEDVYCNVSGFTTEGAPIPAGGGVKQLAPGEEPKWTTVEKKRLGAARTTSRTARSVSIKSWRGASAREHAKGTSPRYASLAGPQSLPGSGAAVGYGWYRLKITSGSAKKRRLLAPAAYDRMHVYVDGALSTLVGVGPGARTGPFDVKLPKGETMVVALMDNVGRFSDGNDHSVRAGLLDHLYEVKPLTKVKAEIGAAEPVNPFALREFILDAIPQVRGGEQQALWSFSHLKRTPIMVVVDGATASGTFVVNDEPIGYYAGASGGLRASFMLNPAEMEHFKRGKNVLRFAPDVGHDEGVKDLMAATTLLECVEAVSADADWSFAKWEPPAASAFAKITTENTAAFKGAPAWWSGALTVSSLPAPAWLEMSGVSKGQVLINDKNLGRYFTATHKGKAVGPQKRLYIPADWLKTDAPNTVLIFDEHGCAPHGVKLVWGEQGDLD